MCQEGGVVPKFSDQIEPEDRKPTFIPFAKARKRIETGFSQFTDQFMLCRNYAKQSTGVFARVISKITASMCQFSLR